MRVFFSIGVILAAVGAGCARPDAPDPKSTTIPEGERPEPKLAAAGPAPAMVKDIAGKDLIFDPGQHPYLPPDQALVRLRNINRFLMLVKPDKVQDDEFPWAVALFDRQVGDRFVPFCGGALISDQWVLTAAHCKIDLRDQLEIGAVDLLATKNHLEIDDVCEYPTYQVVNDNGEDFQSMDLALVKLKTPRNGATRLAIDDGGLGYPPPGDGIVVGWGASAPGGNFTRLGKAKVPTPWPDPCPPQYGPAWPASLFCAGANDGGPGICSGDSGDPLVFPNGSGEWTAVGVASDGCRASQYDRYTRVAPFAEWIQQTIQPGQPRCKPSNGTGGAPQ